MAVVIILGLVFLLVIIGSHIAECAEHKLAPSATLSIVFIIILSVGLTIAGISMEYGDKPAAIDVYRGNTDLEVTYREGVPVDSTVIYKHKK